MAFTALHLFYMLARADYYDWAAFYTKLQKTLHINAVCQTHNSGSLILHCLHVFEYVSSHADRRAKSKFCFLRCQVESKSMFSGVLGAGSGNPNPNFR